MPKKIKFYFWLARFWLEWLRAYILSMLMPQNSKPEAPFFIVGCGRSGNTVLRRVICDNYNVAIPPENPFIYKMVRSVFFAKHDQKAETGIGYLKSKLLEPRYRVLPDGTQYSIDKYSEFSLDFDSVISKINESGSCDAATIFSSIYIENAVKQNRKAWGDKTPVMIFNFPIIRKMFPSARFVFIVRNPVDCAYSYYSRMNVDVEKTAARWLVSSRLARVIERASADSIMTIKYEDLVSNNDQVMSLLAAFLNFEKLPDDAEPYCYGDDLLVHHEKSKMPLNNGSVGNGYSSLSLNDVVFLKSVLGNEAGRLGYDL